MKTTREIGNNVEEIVTQALKQRGYIILLRNVYSRYGELDIVTSKEKRLHIVEVKFQAGNRFGGVECALSKRKLMRIQKSVADLQEKGVLPRAQIQYDYAAVRNVGGRYEVTLFENISLADIQR